MSVVTIQKEMETFPEYIPSQSPTSPKVMYRFVCEHNSEGVRDRDGVDPSTTTTVPKSDYRFVGEDNSGDGD